MGRFIYTLPASLAELDRASLLERMTPNGYDARRVGDDPSAPGNELLGPLG